MKLVITCLLVCFSLMVNTMTSEGAVLEWDENSDADFYVIYWSTDSGTFTTENSMEIPGDITFIELEDSPDGEQYYFSVKAFNDCGNSSDFSDTVISAHLPASVTIGEPIDPKTISATVVGAQENGEGCFINSM